jgi:hypothetical protein
MLLVKCDFCGVTTEWDGHLVTEEEDFHKLDDLHFMKGDGGAIICNECVEATHQHCQLVLEAKWKHRMKEELDYTP